MEPVPLTVAAASSIAQAARLMRAWDVPDILVTDRGRLVGALAQREVAVLAIAADAPPSSITAGEACDAASPRLCEDEPIEAALEIMQTQRLRHVPVIGAWGLLLGCVWRTDAEAGQVRPSSSCAERSTSSSSAERASQSAWSVG